MFVNANVVDVINMYAFKFMFIWKIIVQTHSKQIEIGIYLPLLTLISQFNYIWW